MGFLTGGFVAKILVTTGITASVVASSVAFSGQAGLDAIKGKFDQASDKITDLVNQTQAWDSYAKGLQTNYTASVNQANTTIGQLKVKNAALQTAVNNLSKTLVAATVRIGQLEADKIKLKIEITSLRAQLDKKIDQYEAEVKAHAKTKTTMQAEIDALKSKITDLEKQIVSLDAEIVNLKKQKSELESQITALNVQQKALEDELTNLFKDGQDKLDNLGNDAQNEINRLQDEVGEANTTGQTEIDRLESEVTDANEAVSDTGEYVDGVDISGNGAKDVSGANGYKAPAVESGGGLLNSAVNTDSIIQEAEAAIANGSPAVVNE